MASVDGGGASWFCESNECASFIEYDRFSVGSSYSGVVFRSTDDLLLFVRFDSFDASRSDCFCFSLNSCANFDGDFI